MVANHHALRSRDNIYEYRDSPSSKTLASKIHTDTTSIRSPSSLAMAHKSGSQSSLKSAISLKETNGGTLTSNLSSTRPTRPGALNNGAASITKQQEKRLLTREGATPAPISNTPLITTTTATISAASESASCKPKSTYNIASTTTAPINLGTVTSRSTTPVPSARTHTTTTTLTTASQVQRSGQTMTSVQSQANPQSRTQVIEGVPQTSV